MKILHVIIGLQKAAGTSTFCGEVCNQLAALGHDVTIAVCNPKQQNLYPLDPRVKLVAIGDLGVGGRCGCRAEEKTTPTPIPYTLIHMHGLWSPILHRVSNWAHALNIPVVWSTHGMTAPWAMRHKWWKKCLPWYLYQKRDLKRARLIHCTSDFEVEWNRKLGFERTFLAPLGTFLPEVKKVGRESRSTADDHLSDSNIRTLLFVGRIYPVKALDNVVCAAALMKERVHFRIVGPDQAGHLAELESMAKELGVGERFDFVGPKYGVSLNGEYANCDGLILVSHTENFGATVVDALAHGKPVITSTNTPWKIVAESHSGWWVENTPQSLARAFDAFAETPLPDLAQLGQHGYELVQSRFTWQSVAKLVEEAYNEAQYDCEFAPCGTCVKCYDTCSPERVLQ